MPKKSSILLGLLAAAILLSVSGCARETRLISLTVQAPSATFSFPDPTLQIHFTALGTYIHPPGTRDITSEVTWTTDVPQLLTVTGGVVSPTGAGCGVANVIATSNKDTGDSKNIVIGSASVTVEDPTSVQCPGGSATAAVLTVSLTGLGSGTVTSSPAGINCPVTCGAQFNKNVPITLTPTPNAGSSFGGWGNCPTTSGNACVVTLTGNQTITARIN